MKTDFARTETPTAVRPPLRVLRTLGIGVAGGCALGVVARTWMRLIAEDPDFTWSGTIFIVAGFTIFGLAQSIVALARQSQCQRWKLTVIRLFGGVAMLPLFMGAGMLMFPTVAGGGLAVARKDWHPVVRTVCLVVAAGPVLFVGAELIGSFGWSMQTLAGFVLMVGVYATIIWAACFTFAPQQDGWRLSRRTIVPTLLSAAAILSIVFLAGGGFK